MICVTYIFNSSVSLFYNIIYDHSDCGDFDVLTLSVMSQCVVALILPFFGTIQCHTTSTISKYTSLIELTRLKRKIQNLCVWPVKISNVYAYGSTVMHMRT